MLKKKTVSSFSTLSDALDKIAPDGALIDDSPFAKIDEWLPTGSYILNAVISGSIFGGIPNRRSIMFAGAEGCLQKDEEVEIYILKNNISEHHERKTMC
jgi:hypothetical protein